MFTVKVDLSSIMDNLNGPQMYILLVDPCKMKVIFEFKKWIQFLFSVDFCIRLVYEDAVIHDLEDINILSLLKSVKIEHSVPPKWADKIHDLLAEKANKFDEMFNNRILKSLINKSDINSRPRLTDVEFCSPQMNSSGLSTDGHINKTLDQDWRNMSKEKFRSGNQNQNIISLPEKKSFCQAIEKNKDVQYCSISPSSQHGFLIANKDLNSGWKTNESNDRFDMKRRNIDCTEINLEPSTSYKTKKISEIGSTQDHVMKSDLSKNLNKQLFTSNSINGETHTEIDQLKTENKKLPEISSQYKSKNFIKPFCIGNLLNEMRTESFCKADQNDTPEEHADPLINVSEFADDKKVPFHNENIDCKNNITPEKIIRKRIRKHKSKRKNTDCEFIDISVSSPISFPTFSKSSYHKPLSTGQKPKHIRFDLDANEVNMDYSDNEKNDVNCQELNEIKSSTNDCEDSKSQNDINVHELRNMIEEKRKTLEFNCNKEASIDRDSNCSDLYSSEVNTLNQEKVMENQFVEIQNSLEVLEEKDEQDALENEFPRSIFDITSSPKKKYSNPYVFNRFN